MEAISVGALEQHCLQDQDVSLGRLRELVAIDSGSYTPEGVNDVVDLLEDQMKADGWALERKPVGHAPGGERLGDLLKGRIEGSGGPAILLVGHSDTVFPEGTTMARPLRLEGSRAYGPGVCDMKGGLVVGLAAVRALVRSGFDGFGAITFVVNPDEEIGSPASRAAIVDEASRHDVALVLEAARENGAIVSARKGVTTGHVSLKGRAAHAGVEPERGRNALLAASHLLIALQDLNGRWDGTTVNVGVMRGGSRPNVVAEEASMELELRATTSRYQEAAENEVRRLGSTPTIEGVEASVALHRECGPMERTRMTALLVGMAREVAGELGFELEEAATGGASDANAITATGVPTLDGLGPVGGDDHSDREWIEAQSLPSRIALLAGLIIRIARTFPIQR